MNATGPELLRNLHTLAAGRASDACTDQQLLEQLVTRRKQTAFAALVRRHGPVVLGVCRRVLGHDQDAEDAFQATFLVLVRKAGSIRKHESVGSWLHGVAYHIAQRLRAKETRRRMHERKAGGRPATDPAEDVAWREVRCLLDSELARLPECYRGPLVLCYLQGKTQDEAARQLDWSLRTFRRRLRCGRELLVRRLTRRGVTLSAALTAPLLTDSAAAAVPPLLAANTVRAGLAVATGNAASGLVSAQVAALADGGGKTLLASKMKWALAVLVAVSMAAGGVLTHQTLANRSTAVQPAAPPPAPPAKPAPPRPAAPAADKDKAIEIKGRVVDPEGKPFAGAEVYLVPGGTRKKADLTVHATTDKDGQFRLAARPVDAQSGARLLALAHGHGPDWTDVNKDGETTLHLVKDDVPIRGRVLDLEGRPLAGVTVEISLLAKHAEGGDLSPWIKARQMGGHGQPPVEVPMKYLWPALLGVPDTVKTGADGRFRLSGFGRERLLHLNVRGPTIEDSTAYVITRPGPKGGWPGHYFRIYGATFDYPVGPCKPILGTVHDKATGKPLAGVSVACYVIGIDGHIRGGGAQAITDEKGRYRLTGIGKAKEYAVAAEKLSYINVTKMHIGDTPGLEPLAVDFELTKGITIRGRLTDKATGKPVRGRVEYLARAENPHLKQYPDFSKEHFYLSNHGAIGPDGSFRVLGIPGPGLLCAVADDTNRYAEFDLPGWDGFLLRTVPGGRHPSFFHAIVPIDVSENDAKSTTRDIALEPGRIRTGTVVGPDGKPLTGVYDVGLTPVPQFSFPHRPHRLQDAHFTILGLNPRKDRAIVFFDAEKKLGKVQRLRRDDEGPLTVRLEPLGAIAGRLVDAQGRSWPGMTVQVEVTRLFTAYKDLPWGIIENLGPVLKVTQTTDREGRFRVEGLLPGLQYNLVISEGEIKPGTKIAAFRENLTVESGKKKALGDLKSELVPENNAKEKP